MAQYRHPRTLSDVELRAAVNAEVPAEVATSTSASGDEVGKSTVALRRPSASLQRFPAADPAAALPDPNLARHYAALELPFGAPLTLVETRHIALAEKFHPDKFAHDAEKKEAAEELRARLQAAFDELKRMLSKS